MSDPNAELPRLEGEAAPRTPPIDQLPADHQPTLRPAVDVDGVIEAPIPRLPERPGGPLEDPARVRPQGPTIPPLETTAPTDFVDGQAGLGSDATTRPLVHDDKEFSPLRTDPPPSLLPTMWIRSALVLLMFAALAATLWTEYHGQPGDVGTSALVAGTVGAAVVALLAWSFLTMQNANAIVPPKRYQGPSRGWLAVVLWLGAFVAPIGAVVTYGIVRDRLEDPDDMAAVVILAAAVLVGFVLVWLPFRYHARQATRIGAPHRTMIAWFWLPMMSVVAGVLIMALGFHDQLAEDGFTAVERMSQVGVVFGLPMLLLTLSTWRAVTVFDEVLDLRWNRWKNEWEHTLLAFQDEPEPGPEDSPSLTDSST